MEVFGWVIVAIIIGIPLLGVLLYNKLVSLRNQVKNAWRQIDVQLKRRHDLIPNLVEVVKDYMSYEQETLEKVIQARNQAVSASTPEAAIAAEGILGGAIQVPGDGKPIILMNETVTGGYRKIAVVIAADLPLLGQIAPGDTVRFQETGLSVARELLRGVEAALQWVRKYVSV